MNPFYDFAGSCRIYRSLSKGNYQSSHYFGGLIPVCRSTSNNQGKSACWTRRVWIRSVSCWARY